MKNSAPAGVPVRIQRENLERLRNFCLLDDDFFTKCFEENPECVELVLRIVLEMPDLVVLDVRTQVFLANLLDRSVRLDVLATDADGKKYNIEIQRDSRGANSRRARYNSSMIDANILDKGDDFEKLPETYVIFITENDVMGDGEAVYQIERCILKSGRRFGDGSHIVYVNGAFRDSSPIGLLMQDFSCPVPGKMHYNVLADRARFFKESKEGVAIMCKAMEDLWKQGVEQGIEQGIERGIEQGIEIGEEKKATKVALRMLLDKKRNYAVDEIADISGLSIEEIRKLETENRMQ